jgi:hypothetical protein
MGRQAGNPHVSELLLQKMEHIEGGRSRERVVETAHGGYGTCRGWSQHGGRVVPPTHVLHVQYGLLLEHIQLKGPALGQPSLGRFPALGQVGDMAAAL